MFKFEPSVELTNSAELFDADYSAYMNVDNYLSHQRAIVMFYLRISPKLSFVCNDSVTQFDFFTLSQNSAYSG